MDTTTRTYYGIDDRQTGIMWSILLGIVLGFAATIVRMWAGIDLDIVMQFAGLMSVGIGMVLFALMGHKPQSYAWHQVLGLGIGIGVPVIVYYGLQLI